MNFKEAMAYLENAEVFGSKLGLQNITKLTGLLGNPQNDLKFIHVAGTNGKGSVSAFISSILTEAGYKTGLFTSPHIERFNERIIIDNKEISNADTALALSIVKSKIDEMIAGGHTQPTEFEIVTAAALFHFNSKECDFVVLEVGLGGRLDATNVIGVPEAAVICSIDYDHTAQLGCSISEIAFEKAGIIKEGGVVVTCAQPSEAAKMLERVCGERRAELIYSSQAELESRSLSCQTFNYEKLKSLKITLLGRHQLCNAALAIKTAEALNKKGYRIHEAATRSGLLKTKWPARFELISKTPPIVLDGAHNPHGAKALSLTLMDYFKDKKTLFIMGVLSDKRHEEIIDAVMPSASRFFTVTPNSARALPAESLANAIRRKAIDAKSFKDTATAVNEAIETVAENEIICCFGSLYLMADIKNTLCSLPQTKGAANMQNRRESFNV